MRLLCLCLSKLRLGCQPWAMPLSQACQHCSEHSRCRRLAQQMVVQAHQAVAQALHVLSWAQEPLVRTPLSDSAQALKAVVQALWMGVQIRQAVIRRLLAGEAQAL